MREIQSKLKCVIYAILVCVECGGHNCVILLIKKVEQSVERDTGSSGEGARFFGVAERRHGRWTHDRDRYVYSLLEGHFRWKPLKLVRRKYKRERRTRQRASSKDDAYHSFGIIFYGLDVVGAFLLV